MSRNDRNVCLPATYRRAVTQPVTADVAATLSESIPAAIGMEERPGHESLATISAYALDSAKV